MYECLWNTKCNNNEHMEGVPWLDSEVASLEYMCVVNYFNRQQ